MESISRLTPYISEHGRRTAYLTAGLATEMRLDHETVMLVVLAALLHDIGKSSVPEDILNKPGALSCAEMEIVKKHVVDGYHMLQEDIPEDVAEMVLYHHENMDGSGYLGLRGSGIPMGARIIRVCDVYDALVSQRPYKTPWSRKNTISYMRENAGKLFDETCVDSFCNVVERIS